VTRYGIVVAVQLTCTQPLTPDDLGVLRTILQTITRAELEHHGRVEGPVDVAVREVTPGTGKLTSGQWGSHGI
jgi:hypothetical protein